MIPRAPIGKRIGRGNVAEVFEYGTAVIKIYLDGGGKESAFREASTLTMLEDCELSVPVVDMVGRIEGNWAVVMSRAPVMADVTWSGGELAALHRRVHALGASRLGDLKLKIAANISSARQLGESERSSLLEKLQQLPPGDRLCHGDFHPGNILGSHEAPFIVDWVDATCGPPEADACRTYLLALNNAPELARPYLEAYVEASRCDITSILSWLPVLAAARLAENVPVEQEKLLHLARSDQASR